MAEKSAESAFPVRVVEDELAEDLTHATEAARAAIEAVVDELRDGGAPVDWLRPCEAEARDGTELADCVKLYIPRPPASGAWCSASTGRPRGGGGVGRPLEGARRRLRRVDAAAQRARARSWTRALVKRGQVFWAEHPDWC